MEHEVLSKHNIPEHLRYRASCDRPRHHCWSNILCLLLYRQLAYLMGFLAYWSTGHIVTHLQQVALKWQQRWASVQSVAAKVRESLLLKVGNTATWSRGRDGGIPRKWKYKILYYKVREPLPLYYGCMRHEVLSTKHPGALTYPWDTMPHMTVCGIRWLLK